MCIGYPAQVMALVRPDAIVAVDGRRRRASTLLLPDIAVGDFVVVAAGTIVDRLSVEEAREIQSLLDAAIELHDTERSA
jgi:hydrogenase assembly chaperone HypC/HupF